MGILVDSSVWIEAARPKTNAKNRLSTLITNNTDIICITEPVQTEVCQGARSQEEFSRIWDAFLGFKILPVQTFHWELAAWNYFRCRKLGVTTSTMDCLIATVAVSYRIPLWTLDAGFKKMQPILGFDLCKT